MGSYWEDAQAIFRKYQHLDLVGFAINKNYDTPLHIAAASARDTFRAKVFVESLVNTMTKAQLEFQNKNYNTALCVAAAVGNITTVKSIVKKNKALLELPGSQGMMPLYMASLLGKHKTVRYLYDMSKEMTGDFWNDQNRFWVLLKCLEADMFDVSMKIVTDRPELVVNGTILRILARKPEAFPSRRPPLVRRMLPDWFLLGTKFPILAKYVPTEKSTDAMKLFKIVWGNIQKLTKAIIDEIIIGPPDEISGPTDIIIMEDGKQKPKHSSQLLFLAAEKGNAEFLVEVIRLYPDLIWNTNDYNQTIFHVAVSHRHKNIYTLLYDIGSMKDFITPLKDNEGNNMLHLAAKRSKKNRFQMREELSWFEDVKHMMPPCYREQKNKDGVTPYELFLEEHKDQLSENDKWMKDTANQSLVVAALVAAIGFAAAITVPGGNNQNSGIPMFLHNIPFIVFAISDALSLIYSTCSILMLLDVYKSTYDVDTAMKKLPNTLNIGIIALCYSIIAMLVGFTATFFIFYQDKLKWIPILISALMFIPLRLFYITNYDMIMEFLRSTSGPKFFRQRKHSRLYYQHPRF